MIDQVILWLLAKRLRTRGVCSGFFIAANASIESVARQQIAYGRAESERLKLKLARQAAAQQYEQTSSGSAAIQ